MKFSVIFSVASAMFFSGIVGLICGAGLMSDGVERQIKNGLLSHKGSIYRVTPVQP